MTRAAREPVSSTPRWYVYVFNDRGEEVRRYLIVAQSKLAAEVCARINWPELWGFKLDARPYKGRN